MVFHVVVSLVCPSVHFQHFAARGGFVGLVEVRQLSQSLASTFCGFSHNFVWSHLANGA